MLPVDNNAVCYTVHITVHFWEHLFNAFFRFLIEDQRNPNYYMKDCQALLEAGASASKYFKRAQRLFVAMKKKMAKEDGKKTIVVATADQDASSDNPGLFGEIDSNLMLAGHILGTKDLDRVRANLIQFSSHER